MAWTQLEAALQNSGTAYPVDHVPLRDPDEQLSYCIKFVTYHRPGRRRVPLPPDRLLELAAWCAPHRFEDFLFAYGARRRGGRRVDGPARPCLSTSKISIDETFCLASRVVTQASACKVMSDFSALSASRNSRCGSSLERRYSPILLAAREPLRSKRCTHSPRTRLPQSGPQPLAGSFPPEPPRRSPGRASPVNKLQPSLLASAQPAG